MSPTSAFLLLVGGILLLYGEFIWVGRVFLGLSGSLLAICGLSVLLKTPQSCIAPLWVLLAVVCILVEAAVDTYWLAGTLGAILFAWEFIQLGVSGPVAVAASAALGGLTIWLLTIAKRARRNKRDA